jgi:two-component system OmpR family response regulator
MNQGRVPFTLPTTPVARVLLVDDIREITRYMTMMIAPAGFEVACAFDGLGALKSAKFFRPHVILLNLIMPGLSGVQTLPLLRSAPELAGVKVILHSGDVFIEETARRCAADGFLLKPFGQKQLLAEIARVLTPS